MVGYLPGAILRAPDGANNDTASALQWCNARDFLPSIRHNLDRFDIQHWNELFLVVYCSLYGIADLEIKCSQKNPWLVTKRADVKRNLQGWVALGRPALSSRWWSSCRQLGNVSKEMTQWHLPTLTLQTQESMVSSKILLLIVTVCQGKQPPACLFANSRTLQCN